MKSVIIKAMIAASCISAASVASSFEQEEKRFPESQYRHDVMEMSKLSLSGILQHFRGQAKHEGHVAELADMMAKSAALSKAAFEKDTRGMEGHTEAKGKIWDNWEDFASRMDTYAADTKAFAEAAKSGDPAAMRPAFGKAVKNCKSCHDEYRK